MQNSRRFFAFRPLFAAAFALALSWIFPGAANAEEGDITDPKTWELYGSAKLGAAQWHREKWYQLIPGVSDTSVKKDSLPINRFFMDLQYNSFFGARAKSKQMGFNFELGWGPGVQQLDVKIEPGPQISASKRRRQVLRLRKLYGEWYINEKLTLLVGQDNALSNLGSSSQVFFMDQGLGYSGGLATGRAPMVKFTVASGNEADLSWKGQFALIKSDTFLVAISQAADAEEKGPKVEVGGELGLKISDMFGVRAQAVGGYNKYDMVVYPDLCPGCAPDRQDINGALVGGGIDLDVWKATLGFTYTWGKNIASYGQWFSDPDGSRLANNVKVFFPFYDQANPLDTLPNGLPHNAIRNAFTQMGTLVLNVHPTNWFAVEAGAGLVRGRHEANTIKIALDANINGMRRLAYYVNTEIALANRHFLIVPEYSFSDFGGLPENVSNGDFAGRWTSYGLKLEMKM